ncbi:ATP-binding cassette subfamily B protein [Tumebacillus sp. BK434]|uniref:ABC transporter ATP-binding protein n=1 Tax=Tumebacillus sp. BK434 TaxID=2512169 RepID=UPI00104EF5DA|nr:ABC transporter ATP-binding protein [Tumebacillus sp. BK434]TCP58036.1 ATP-binding cassette subfamily B protein [Tumebacillus sp. BK434]
MYGTMLKKGLGEQKARVAALGALLLGGALLQLGSPLVLRRYIDAAKVDGALDVLIWAALLFLALTAVRQFVQVAGTYLAEQVGWTATNRLRTELFLHALRLDLNWHKEKTAGEMMERVDGDVTALANFFSRFVLKVAANVLLLLGMVAVLFTVDWRVGAAFLIFVGAALWLLNRIREIAVPHWVAARKVNAEFYGFLGERLAGLEEIQANGAGGYVMRRFFERMRVLLSKERTAYVRGRALWPATVGLFAAGYVLVFALGSLLYEGGQITLGTFYLMFAYVELLRGPLDQITEEMQDFQKAAASVQRVGELMAVQSREPDEGRLRLPEGKLGVEFAEVSFGYGEEAVLEGVSFAVQPGRVLGVLGRTGSGKTTLTRLLLRLYEPDAGAVTLGGVDVRSVPLAELRGKIGMVTQEVRLFGATVRDNVTLFDPAVPDARIAEVLEELGLGDWLRALPQGLGTMLDGSGGLSAGEAQLLSFARVFLRDPALVIFDEASSRLDPATERLIERAVRKLLTGRTAILIAHRLSTLQIVDDVLVLADGRVAEYGARDTLSRTVGSRLWQLQNAGREEVLG